MNSNWGYTKRISQEPFKPRKKPSIDSKTMKTKEFIRQVEKLGYTIIETDDDWYPQSICIHIMKEFKSKDGDIRGITELANVSEHVENRLDIRSSSHGLTKLIIKYAETPIAEREDEKKYYIKVLNDDRGYLNNYSSNHDEAIISAGEQHKSFKTQFTETEIAQLKRCRDIPLDWDKVELIEVEDDLLNGKTIRNDQ